MNRAGSLCEGTGSLKHQGREVLRLKGWVAEHSLELSGAFLIYFQRRERAFMWLCLPGPETHRTLYTM